MKKEIKFRAWNRTTKKIGMPLDYLTVDGATRLLNSVHYAEESGDELILMQYTGLKDKNGKGIYEGDIVEVRMAEDYGGETDENGKLKLLCRQEVKPSEESNGYFTDEDTGEYCPALGSDEIEVEIIGNIYENSELLK